VPVAQRDAARVRLVRIKKAVESYDIVPGKAVVWRTQQLGDEAVLITITNRGRGAQFSAVFEGIGENSDLWSDYLPWQGSPATVEEIPTGESRQIILVGVRQCERAVSVHGWEWALPSDAENLTWYPAAKDKHTFWIRVSARNVPEISYSRRIGVIKGGPGWMPGFAPEPADAVTFVEVPALKSLLDFGTRPQ
jgi:hypothetical protein